MKGEAGTMHTNGLRDGEVPRSAPNEQAGLDVPGRPEEKLVEPQTRTLQHAGEPDRAEHFFENYENDSLYAMPRAPTEIYVYWSLTEERLRMVERHFARPWPLLQKGLKIYDVNAIDFDGDAANQCWTYPVNEEAKQWFVSGLLPDCHYVLDYGVVTEEGGFFTLLRSNPVKLPPNEPYRENWTRPERQTVHGTARNVRPDDVPAWVDRFTGYSLQSETHGKERN